MGHQGAAVLLAVLGAACFAAASVLQHQEVHTGHQGDEPGRLATRRLLAIMRRPPWLAGLGLAGVGATVHAVALLLAPLRLVQPVGVLAVPLAVLITAARTRRRPAGGVVVGTAVSIAGVVVFVAASAGSTGGRTLSSGAAPVVGVMVLVVVALLALAGSTRSGPVRCVALATAGASAFGLLSVLVRLVSRLAADGAAPGDPRVLGVAGGVVASLAVGGWLVQHAYHAGSPEVVIACLTVVDPVVAVLLGALLLGEGGATAAATWAVLAAAATAGTAGVLTLARHHPDAVRGTATARGAALVPTDPRSSL